ncbi:acyl-coenzyme A thioesterase 13 [Manihot esculenta]|uniref:Thioesterase domain-containing protein n=1 Tax=Manihot esculenta TaxID=3983 RepID=A0A2C9VVH7_MANES|nr:acyl-coenzyme A thioesterase 13 [Manihot esculenta]
MTKTSNSITSRLEETSSSTTEYAEKVESFLTKVGICASISESNRSKDFYSNLLRDLLKVNHVQFGRISCDFSVLPIVANHFNSLHGGAVAAIAERVAIACVRTVEAEDREISLGELVISYLSAAPQNEAVIVDGRVQRSGRNITVVAMEFRIKKNGKLVYTANATFYHLPFAKL